MKRFLGWSVLAMGCLALAGCNRNSSTPSEPAAKTNAVQKPKAADTNQNATATSTNWVVLMKTTAGDMVFELWPDVAPKTVANFEKLVKQGFYDGTAFHRIIKGFMAQGGDPMTKSPSLEDHYGEGNPGYAIPAEFNDRPHERGVLSMARGNDPDSAGSQFFIVLERSPHLDRQYTAFGKLMKGDDVLTKIGDTPVVANKAGEMSKPTTRVAVESIKLVLVDSVK